MKTNKSKSRTGSVLANLAGVTLLVAVALASSHFASASVIFTDTFDSGTGAWYKAYTSANTLANDGDGRLSFTHGGDADGREVIGRSFSEQTLAVGESMTLSYDYRQTSATGVLRVGLYNLFDGATASADDWANRSTGSYAGYATFIRDSGTNVARRQASDFDTATNTGYPTSMQGLTDIGSTSNNYTFEDDTDYQITFSVTRTSSEQTDTLLTVMEGATERYSVAGSQTSGSQLGTFNTVVLRTGSGTALYDNVQLAVIPEPASAAALLGGLALLALFGYRRRRM